MISGSSTGWPLREPKEMLAGCVWLARLTDKIRLHHVGELPEVYTSFLGHPRGVDGHFLRHFDLSFTAISDAIIAADDDSGVERWFLHHPNSFKAEIESWNTLAPNLGRAGYPMSTELPFVINRFMEPEAQVPGIATIFEAIVLDDIAIVNKHRRT